MQSDVRTAQIFCFAPPPFIQKIMQEKQYTTNRAFNKIMAYFPFIHGGTEEQIYHKANEMISIAKLADHYGQSIFGYRGGKVLSGVYYAIAVKDYARNSQGPFPNLPDDLDWLQPQMESLKENPDNFASPNISPDAKFACKIQMLYQLRSYLNELRNGSLPVQSEEAAELYVSLVMNAPYVTLQPDCLAQEIIKTVKKINYVLNHFENSIFCPHIGFSMKDGNDVFDIGYSLDRLHPEKSKQTKNIFSDVCQVFQDRSEGSAYDDFYEIYEKIIFPINLTNAYNKVANPLCSDFLIAHAGLSYQENQSQLRRLLSTDFKAMSDIANEGNFSDNAFKKIGASTGLLNSFMNSLAISELNYLRLKLWGKQIEPIYDGNDVFEVVEKVRETEDLQIDNYGLNYFWKHVRENTIDSINMTLRDNEDIARELRPYLPEGPLC